ncbi:MAG: hypothetical protein RIS29_1544 [Bacteroidota bacterium]|jgi:cellulose synthase/poly-beta-1,6-N-acetylglucosamine synthase-like glycosyltransferase
MENTFFTSYYILQLVLLILTGSATAYILFFATASLFYRKRKEHKAAKLQRFAVFIPGYKEDEVIIEVAEEALKQSYPADMFDVIIVADSFQPSTLDELRKMPLKVIEVSFDKSTKAKALNKAMSILPENYYDVALILDADNIMEYRFIEKLNMAFDKGFVAVQGHRAAKNLNTGLAILDAVSEEINNNLFRQGHRAVGMSSGIIGSGMAFNYDYFKNMMKNVVAVSGFDKEIELIMSKAKTKIEYLNDAWVYDEKVQTSDVFVTQRRRWLYAQFYYFKQDFGTAVWHLLTRFNVDYFDKAIQFIQPPRVLLIGEVVLLTAIFGVANYLLNTAIDLTYGWIITLIACVLAFLFAVPKRYYNMETAKAVLGLPKGMILMTLALLQIKGANKQFLHTKHTSTKTAIKK